MVCSFFYTLGLLLSTVTVFFNPPFWKDVIDPKRAVLAWLLFPAPEGGGATGGGGGAPGGGGRGAIGAGGGGGGATEVFTADGGAGDDALGGLPWFAFCSDFGIVMVSSNPSLVDYK